MLWLFLFAVKIAETVRFQVDKILIGAEALRRVIDLVEEVAVLRFRFKHADFLVSRRSFGRNAAHLRPSKPPLNDGAALAGPNGWRNCWEPETSFRGGEPGARLDIVLM